MKLLDRHILQELVPTFLATVILFAGFILIAGGPLLLVVKYLSQGVPVMLVVRLAGLYLPPNLILAFPMGILIAVILGFTRLSNDSEAVAMFASGVSFYRMLVPTALFGLVVAGLGLWINNTIAPAASREIATIRGDVHDLPETTQAFALPPQYDSKTKKLQSLVWVEGGYNQQLRAIEQVTIVEYNPDGKPAATIYAKTAQWLGENNWELTDVEMTAAGVVNQFPTLVTHDIHQTANGVEFQEADPDTLSFAELAQRIKEQKRAGVKTDNTLRQAEESLWDKISLPVASFIFALVGAPLALRPQRGASRQAAFGFGILIILGYYAIEKYLEILGAGGQVDPALAAFVPNIIGIALAAYLISRATT